MAKLNRYSTSTTPPPRPAKSNLRSITTEKLLNATNSIRKQGRFIEHFEQLPPQELLDIISDADDKHVETKRPRRRTLSSTTLNGSVIQNASTMTTTTSSTPPPATASSDGDNSYFPPLQRPLSRKLSTASRRSMTASLSTPPSQTLSSATTSRYDRSSRRRHFSAATTGIYRRPSSTLANSVGVSRKLSTLFSLNRAAVIIARLEQWLQLIKCVVQWLEETAKLHLQISRGYSQRHLPLFQMELQPDQTPAASTIYAGLRLLTTNVADANHHFAGDLQRVHIPALLKFKRECKEKIRVLRNDPHLLLDDLLRRAEQTKKCMDQLNKVCQSAENHQQQQQQQQYHPRHEKSTLSDPWLANLYVLRQLKREIDEENRLRHLMVSIQKETADFETRLLATLKPAVQYCCEHLSPAVWNGSDDEETAPFQLMMDRILPDSEWKHFYEREEKELVDEQQVAKDYLNINYTNKLHDMVVTLKKGTMQRYMGGVRTKFSDRLYVLSQGGYLHQFRMDDKVVPERSIYIPHSTVSCLDDCTFEIRRPIHGGGGGGGTAGTEKSGSSLSSAGSDTNTPQRLKKVYVIKANNTEEMQSWCQILSDMAAGRLAVRRPRKFGRITMIQQKQQQPKEDLSQLEDEPSTDSLVSSISSTSHALMGYRHHFEKHELPPLPVSTTSSVSSAPASPVILSSLSTPSKIQPQIQPPLSSSKLTNEELDIHLSSAKLATDDQKTIVHPATDAKTEHHSIQLNENKVGMVGAHQGSASVPLQELGDANNVTAPSTDDDNGHSHQQELFSTSHHSSGEKSIAQENASQERQLQTTTIYESTHPLDGQQKLPELEDTMIENGNNINNINNNNDDDDNEDDSDDSGSTISSHGSVSTVTRRYSLLPTSSNNLLYDSNINNDDDDDDDVSVYTEYDDAASHISRFSISTTSTHYDDAASSLYFSSNMSARSAGSSPSSSRRSSIEFNGYQHSMVIPDLEEQHA